MQALRRLRRMAPLVVLLLALAVSAFQLGAKANARRGCNLEPCHRDSDCYVDPNPQCWNCINGACQYVE